MPTTTDSNREKVNNTGAVATEKTSASWKEKLAAVVGILVLLGFSWLVIYLVRRTGRAEELEWTRAVYIFGGVEAIAFAAAGFFFGKEVHRERAEKAENDADDAKEQADEARDQARDAEKHAIEAETKGRSLTMAIKSKKTALQSKAGPYGSLGKGKAVQVTQADFEELEVLASQLFP